MIKAFFWSKKWFWWAYGMGLFLLTSLAAQVYVSVKINEWYKPFYDLLQNAAAYVAKGKGAEGAKDFGILIVQFGYLAGIYVLIATITSYFARLYSFRWREAMTFHYIPRWRNVTEEVENANQRIQDDTFRFSRIIESLGMQVAEAAMTLIAFVPILWKLSELIAVPLVKGAAYQAIIKNESGAVIGTVFNPNFISGSLVWVALLVSVGGMIISWFVGIKLPKLEYNNQKVEANYRAELVLGEKIDKTKHATTEILTKLFQDVKYNYHRLFLHYGYFDVWRGSYSQFMVIIPYIFAGPSLFGGLIGLGILRQIANSFDQVRGSLSLFINNWTTITELRSIHMRLKEFEINLGKHQPKEEKEEEKNEK